MAQETLQQLAKRMWRWYRKDAGITAEKVCERMNAVPGVGREFTANTVSAALTPEKIDSLSDRWGRDLLTALANCEWRGSAPEELAPYIMARAADPLPVSDGEESLIEHDEPARTAPKDAVAGSSDEPELDLASLFLKRTGLELDAVEAIKGDIGLIIDAKRRGAAVRYTIERVMA